MAHRLKYWISYTVGACLVVAAAYLPPQAPSPSVGLDWRDAPELAPFLRADRANYYAQRRAERATAYLNSLQQRDSLLAALGKVSDNNYSVLVAPEFPAEISAALRGLLDSAPTPAVPVVVALMGDTTNHYTVSEHALPRGSGPCLTVIVLGRGTARVAARGLANGVYFESPAALVGACAYYAAFGPVGAGVGEWLEDIGYQAAFQPLWFADGLVETRQEYQEVFRDVPYSTVNDFTLCAASDVRACRALALLGHPYQPQRWDRWSYLRPKRLAFSRSRWWRDEQLGPRSGEFLSDLITQYGEPQFAEFWRSELPVEAAFDAAFGMPIEQWIMRWVQRDIVRWAGGPKPPRASVLLALGTAVLFVTGGTVLARWRQIG